MNSRKTKLRGLKTLVHDGVDATVDLVAIGNASGGRMVTSVTDHIDFLRQPVRMVDNTRTFVTNGVLKTIKVANKLIEVTSDSAIDFLQNEPVSDVAPSIPLRSDIVGSAEWWRDASVAFVNGAVGDHLADTDNGLAETLSLRIPNESPSMKKIAIFVHGLGTTEWSWFLNAESYYGDPTTSFASNLERDEGFTPIFVRYNTGRSLVANGADLSAALDDLHDQFGQEIEEIVVIGHSMGGLVAREASLLGGEWNAKVSRFVYLGSPHAGAPLARIARVVTTAFSAVDLPAYQVLGRIFGGRSGGIQDLAEGALSDDLDTASEHIFVAATISKERTNAVGNMVGDLLVRVTSAHGGELDSKRVNLQRYHAGRVLHHQLQNHPVVYDMMLNALRVTA